MELFQYPRISVFPKRIEKADIKDLLSILPYKSKYTLKSRKD
jgi:hypothetical protein